MELIPRIVVSNPYTPCLALPSHVFISPAATVDPCTARYMYRSYANEHFVRMSTAARNPHGAADRRDRPSPTWCARCAHLAHEQQISSSQLRRLCALNANMASSRCAPHDAELAQEADGLPPALRSAFPDVLADFVASVIKKGDDRPATRQTLPLYYLDYDPRLCHHCCFR